MSTKVFLEQKERQMASRKQELIPRAAQFQGRESMKEDRDLCVVLLPHMARHMAGWAFSASITGAMGALGAMAVLCESLSAASLASPLAGRSMQGCEVPWRRTAGSSWIFLFARK